MLRTKFTSLLLPFGLSSLVFMVYLHNLSASVYGGDSGDFLSAIAVKGVPHPSGYPLYTLLGIIFNSLPIHQTIAWKVDLISALFSSLTVLILYALVKEMTKSKLLALITSLTLAFLFPFWLFAEVSEVFGLHHFFLILLFYLGFMFYRRKRTFYLYLLSFVFGLSLTNHELTILIFPSLLLFVVGTKNKVSPVVVVRCVGLLVLGLLPYLYIPLAASRNPAVNWGNASSFLNSIALVMRTAYGWSGGDTHLAVAARLLSLQNYILYLLEQLPLPVLLCLPLGVVGMVKQRQRRALLAALVGFFLFGPLFFWYRSYISLSDTQAGISEKFYTSSILFLLILLPYGIQLAVKSIIRVLSVLAPVFLERTMYPRLFTGLFLLVPGLLLINNFKVTDLHAVSIGDQLGRDALSALPQASTMWVTEDDNIPFNSRYMQYAFGIRRDVRVLAGLDLPQQDNIQSALKLHAFPYGDRENATILAALQLAKTHPTFIMLSDYDELNHSGKSILVPYGLLLKVEGGQAQQMDEQGFLKRQQALLAGLTYTDASAPSQLSYLKLIEDIPLIYANAYANTGLYLIDQYHDFDRAKPFFEQALKFAPASDSAYEGLGDYFASKHACQQAQKAYESATELNMMNLTAYHKRYDIVTACLHDGQEAQRLRSLASKFPDIFSGVIPQH